MHACRQAGMPGQRDTPAATHTQPLPQPLLLAAWPMPAHQEKGNCSNLPLPLSIASQNCPPPPARGLLDALRTLSRPAHSHRCHELEGQHCVGVAAGHGEHVQVCVPQVHERDRPERPDGRLHRAGTIALLGVEDLRPEVLRDIAAGRGRGTRAGQAGSAHAHTCGGRRRTATRGRQAGTGLSTQTNATPVGSAEQQASARAQRARCQAKRGASVPVAIRDRGPIAHSTSSLYLRSNRMSPRRFRKYIAEHADAIPLLPRSGTAPALRCA